MSEQQRVRWHIETEWVPLLTEAIPHSDRTGEPLAQCIERVMQHQLPPERWRTLNLIRTSLSVEAIKQCIKEIRKRFAQAPAPAVRPHPSPPSPPAPTPTPAPLPTFSPKIMGHALSQAEVQRMRRSYKGGVHWTQREWALLARDYDARIDQGMDSFLSLLDAQDAVIDLERRRAVGGLRKEWQRGRVQRGLEEGRASMWTLPENVTETLEQALQEPPTEVPKEEYAQQQAPFTEEQIEQGARIDFSPAVESPKSSIEPFAAEVSRILASAVNEILKAHQARVMDAFDQRLQVFVQGVRAEVHATLEHELGGPVQAPKSPVAPPIPPAPTQPPRYDLPGVLPPAKALSVDVVGFNGTQAEAVRRGLNGEVDVRFISTEHAKTAAQHFRPYVIVATQFMSHAASDRIKRQAKRYIPITGNASQAIAAIEQLLAEQTQHVH